MTRDLIGCHGHPLALCMVALAYGERIRHSGRDEEFAPGAFRKQFATGQWSAGPCVVFNHDEEFDIADGSRVSVLDTAEALYVNVVLPDTPRARHIANLVATQAVGVSISFREFMRSGDAVTSANIEHFGLTLTPAYRATAAWRDDAVDLPQFENAWRTRFRIADMRATTRSFARPVSASAPPAKAVLEVVPKSEPYSIKASVPDAGEIWIYDMIGDGFQGVTAKQFAVDLAALGDVKVLNIFINSPGGSVFDGVAIFNTLKRHKARKVVHIDGLAASIASVIAMAGNEIRIAKNGMMMIHDPWGLAVGSADELRKVANSLDKVRGTLLATYAGRATAAESQIDAWMTAETWFTSAEAIAAGLADTLTDTAVDIAAMARFDLSKFKCIPTALRTARYCQ